MLYTIHTINDHLPLLYFAFISAGTGGGETDDAFDW